MDIFSGFILSVVEGFTEFLPVSSTGHLVLVARLMGVAQSDFVKSFEIIIQLGAILSVVILYRKVFLKEFQTLLKVLTAFVPTAVLGFVLYPVVKGVLLGNEYIALAALAGGGLGFIIIENLLKKRKPKIFGIQSLSFPRAVVIGLAQSLSMVPGVSRAAATIFAGLIVGMERKTAVEFSFLLAVPTMLAATVLDLFKSDFLFTQNQWIVLAVGFFGSFVFALAALKFLLSFIKTHSFIPFGIYRIIIAVLYFLFVL